MIGFLYKQTYPHDCNIGMDLEVTEQELEYGFAYIPCYDCDGTGKFSLPDDELVDCVQCKASGRLPINVI